MVAAAALHAAASHGHEDTPELHEQLRAMLEPESAYAPGERTPVPFPGWSGATRRDRGPSAAAAPPRAGAPRVHGGATARAKRGRRGRGAMTRSLSPLDDSSTRGLSVDAELVCRDRCTDRASPGPWGDSRDNPCRRQGDRVVAPGSTGRRLLDEDDRGASGGAPALSSPTAWRRAPAARRPLTGRACPDGLPAGGPLGHAHEDEETFDRGRRFALAFARGCRRRHAPGRVGLALPDERASQPTFKDARSGRAARRPASTIHPRYGRVLRRDLE